MPALGRTETLVEAIRDSLPAKTEWDEREVVLLELAAKQATDTDRLEADIARHGVRVPAR